MKLYLLFGCLTMPLWGQDQLKPTAQSVTLKRILNVEQIERPFTSLFMIFTDSTFDGWPGGNGYATYHDRRLSEGFAEYFGLMYTQFSRENNDDFFRFLKDYRETLLNRQEGLTDKLLGEDIQLGPVWLGYRNHTSATTGGDNLVLYCKGAWVLHMLRMMAIDLNTMNEDGFRQMMKEYYESSKTHSLRTIEFQRTVEKYFGRDMQWFFDQWVYGYEIPRYEVASQIVPTKNGRHKVRLRIYQSGVTADFQMPVPILVNYGGERSSRFRIMVKGPITEVETPELPLEPRRVTFNYLESVLCDLKEKSWYD